MSIKNKRRRRALRKHRGSFEGIQRKIKLNMEQATKTYHMKEKKEKLNGLMKNAKWSQRTEENCKC